MEVGCKKFRTMRITKIFLAVIVALSTIACTNNNGDDTPEVVINWESNGSVIGEWRLSSWNGKSDSAPMVYVKFNEEDLSFDMYQKAYSQEWHHYKGTYTLSEDYILEGVYADGVAWSNAYKVDFAFEPKHIRLSSVNGLEVSIYDETTIPTSVVEESKPQTNTEENTENEEQAIPSCRSVVIKRFL